MPEKQNEFLEEIEEEENRGLPGFGKRPRVNTNKIALIVIISGYLLFFLVSRFLPSTRALLYTPVGEEMEFGQSRLYTISRWDYSPSQKIMEVELDIVNNAFDGHDTYNFQARQRAGQTTQLDTEIIIEEPSFVVIQILGVADKFEEVSLLWSPQGIDNYGICKLYTNKDVVNRVENISVKTKEEYYLDRLKRNLESHKETLDSLNAQISENRKTIQEILAQNEEIEANKIYQTPEDIAISDARIEANNKRVSEIEEQIDKLRDEAASLETLIADIQNTIEELEGGI